MTTIAFDGKTLACDMQISYGDHVYANRSKKVDLDCGGVLVGAGELQDTHLVAEWINGGRDPERKPPVGDGYSAFVVIGGVVYELEHKLILIPASPNVATGSGWGWATAAMDFGCNAVEAIEYAGKRDGGTSGLEIVYERQSAI